MFDKYFWKIIFIAWSAFAIADAFTGAEDLGWIAILGAWMLFAYKSDKIILRLYKQMEELREAHYAHVDDLLVAFRNQKESK